MKKLAVCGVTIFLLGLILTSPKLASASEGIFELRNTAGQMARCWVASVLMPDFNYSVLVSCRDIIYPAGPELNSYILWATPVDGKGYIKLGQLGRGKVEYKTPKQFVELFVTLEQNEGKNEPTTPAVMRGYLQKISFLDKEPSSVEEVALKEKPTVTPTLVKAPENQTVSRLRILLPTLFIAAFATMLMLYLITRFRS